MGGNAKHMPHIWEHYDSTFADVFSILESLTSGNTHTTEKYDGVNIHFRVDNTGVTRFSRNAGDMAKGGLTFSKALNVYEGHPAKDTFIEGFRAIDEHFSHSWWPFGFSGRDWINAEIVDSRREQMLKYDKNAIVMHNLTTFTPGTNVKPFIDPVKSSRLRELAMPDIATLTCLKWDILSPTFVEMPNDLGLGYLVSAKERLSSCLALSGLNEQNTLRDFLRHSLLAGSISKIKTSQHIKERLADKISGFDKTVRLVDLKKNQPSGVAKMISFYGQVKNEMKHQRVAMSPIINTIDAFSSSRLEKIKSFLIDDAINERNRIMLCIEKDAGLVNEITDAFQQERIDMFNKHFNEWKQVSNLPAAIEGVTFEFVNKPTKITGGFASLNQLLGICRYGRGPVPPITVPVLNEKKSTSIEPGWFAIK